MITRRRRQGSESEQQTVPLTQVQTDGNIVKGPSSVLQWSENYSQPSVPLFFVAPSQVNTHNLNLPAVTRPIVTDSRFSQPLKHESETSDVAMASLVSNMSTVNVASRDRTAEFNSAVRSLQSRNSNGMVIHSRTAKSVDSHRNYNEFMGVAKIISKDLANTYTKLEKLTLLAKKRSLFNDRPQEIDELTCIIKEDISSLNKQIGQLRNFTQKQQNQHQNSEVHSRNIVVSLQSKLASMSSDFKQVLEVRTENMKAQKTRRQQFTGNPVVSDLPMGGSQSGAKGSLLLHDEFEAQRGETVSIDMGGASGSNSLQKQQLMFADETDSYLQSRNSAVQTIESTIVELGGIFQQLALMVREQEEMVQRIDSNVDDAHLNVEGAHDELLRYFRSVSSNRWLMMKVFGVIIIFVIIFAIFLA